MDIPALPFCRVVLKTPKPPPPFYPNSLKTLGDHLKKKRLDLNILQKEVAKQIGVDEMTINNWENNKAIPLIRYIPQIIKFLRYNPFPESKTIQEKLILYRKIHGLSQRKLAKILGVDPGTLGRWERDKSKPIETIIRKLEPFLFLNEI